MLARSNAHTRLNALGELGGSFPGAGRFPKRQTARGLQRRLAGATASELELAATRGSYEPGVLHETPLANTGVDIDPLLRGDDLALFSRGDELGAELRQQNWPKATKVAQSDSVEEWQLGPNENWVANPESHGKDRYSLHYQPPDAGIPQS